MKDKTVVIIGGGPAGMMAAITAGEHCNNVILVEKNSRLGKKLKITGGGRCNLTNDKEPAEIIDKVITNNKFLYKSLEAFTSQDLIKFMEDNGCPVIIEDDGCVFPKSNNSSDVINIFYNLLKKNNVKLYLGKSTEEILIKNNKIESVKINENNIIACDSVILATGGVSYPGTGSTGFGHKIANNLGHTITPLKPALVPIEIKEKWITKLSGMSFENVAVKTKIANKLKTIQGDLLITHFGISGPAVLKLSSYLNKLDPSSTKSRKQKLIGHSISIDFVPNIPHEELKEIFTSSKYSNKQVSTLLTDYLPKNFVKELLENLEVDNNTSLNQLTKKERGKIINSLKDFNITVKSLRDIKEATVTSGGINTKEVNPKTMESKLIKGLYFAGEILDVDALTGGYNLQIAFSTGYVAGINSVS
ncbi:NAD(P)/FAD-dependent oxidoreductase [Natranaerofaba carboxydovora]|uniref:NAD(P)/FAD-dependent oxidoreductase n=1 Tax=Natranaerofaba carboxydovora TaxID=2742683 RepID=UPI001F144DA8|nr:NAD(P)/FAD-dependent oxidoreductase [Natranaerofaba carboxydovora]UMZ72502.1 HI0933-like protein [Natranaerofaba carboxydovora]